MVQKLTLKVGVGSIFYELISAPHEPSLDLVNPTTPTAAFIQIMSSLVSSPDPTLSRGKGSGNIGTISWSCTPSRDSIELNVLSHMNAELAQPRNRSNVTRPFSSQRVGSGDETMSSQVLVSCPDRPRPLEPRDRVEGAVWARD